MYIYIDMYKYNMHKPSPMGYTIMTSLNLQNYNYNVPYCIAFQRRHTLRLIWQHGVMDVGPQLND